MARTKYRGAGDEPTLAFSPVARRSASEYGFTTTLSKLRRFPVINAPTKSTDFFVWLGLSRGFEQHAASLRNGLRMQAQTRPARARRRHSELWQRRATTPDGERRDLIGMFIILETAIDRLLPIAISYLLEGYRSLKHHQMGEHATYPIARFSSRLALLLLLAWDGHAASSRLAKRPEKRTLRYVQSPFLVPNHLSFYKSCEDFNVS